MEKDVNAMARQKVVHRAVHREDDVIANAEALQVAHKVECKVTVSIVNCDCDDQCFGIRTTGSTMTTTNTNTNNV